MSPEQFRLIVILLKPSCLVVVHDLTGGVVNSVTVNCSVSSDFFFYAFSGFSWTLLRKVAFLRIEVLVAIFSTSDSFLSLAEVLQSLEVSAGCVLQLRPSQVRGTWALKQRSGEKPWLAICLAVISSGWMQFPVWIPASQRQWRF